MLNPFNILSIKVNAHGLAGLASGLKNLTELDVGGCERVDDSALRALCSMNAQFLNLSGCAAITETGVAGIAMNCTALSSLNVTGCPGIGRRFMAELCHSMQLSEPAQAYFGFQVLSCGRFRDDKQSCCDVTLVVGTNWTEKNADAEVEHLSMRPIAPEQPISWRMAALSMPTGRITVRLCLLAHTIQTSIAKTDDLTPAQQTHGTLYCRKHVSDSFPTYLWR